MLHIQHNERHFKANASVKDIVIGMSDGLTVPFALAAGLTGAISSTHFIVTAGIAEIVAGSIAMGLGGFLAARSEFDHYMSERKREEDEIVSKPQAEEQEIHDILETYGLKREESTIVVAALRRNPHKWVDFMMRFELGLEKPEKGRALKSALTIATAYIVGGLIPLSSYIFLKNITDALKLSLLLTSSSLIIFGAIKGKFTGISMMRSAYQTLLVGGLAALAAFLLARCINLG